MADGGGVGMIRPAYAQGQKKTSATKVEQTVQQKGPKMSSQFGGQMHYTSGGTVKP